MKLVQRFEWGEVVWLHEPGNSSERLSAGLVKFFPGSRQGQHVHFGEEQILFALNGKGVHRLNGKEEEISEGMLIHCPPFSEHEVINTGDEDLVFLITYTPSKQMRETPKERLKSSRSIQEILDSETLEKIEREICDTLRLELEIMDSGYKNAAKRCGKKEFWNDAAGLRRFDSGLAGLDKAFVGSGSVITMIIPILLEEEIVGYLRCGQFLINRDESFEEMLSPELLKAYREIPLIPKSRLFALQESLESIGDLISGIIEAGAREKGISERRARTKLTEGLKTRSINIWELISDDGQDYPIQLEEELASMIRKLDRDAAKSAASEIAGVLRKRRVPAYEVRDTVGEMVMGIARELFLDDSDRDSFFAIRYKYRSKLKNCSDCESAGQLLAEFAEDSIGIMENRLLKGKPDLVERINSYIGMNFRSDVSLNGLAEIFYISPNYLSAIFNEKNEMSLTDYVNRLRVEEAKKLLRESGLKVSEISRKVGYSRLSYFGSIFRRLEGCTPKEYRKS
jgi:AraC-like DNA-binding protein/quercetin dioxygenase-like cupin family protein